MEQVQIIVADTSAQNPESYLAVLERISSERDDGGMIHGGHIHYIQSHFEDFVSKAAIVGILENVPQVFPLNFGELLEHEDFEPTEAQGKAFQGVNEGLLIPISGEELAKIIELAKEYENLGSTSPKI